MKILIGLVVTTLGCIHASSLLVDGSFENPTISPGLFTLYGTGQTIGAWTVTGTACGANCVLALETTYSEEGGTLVFQAQDGRVALDLTGSGNTGDGGVEQTVATSTSVMYSLTFWVGNMDDRDRNYTLPSSVQLLINNVPIDIYTVSASTNGMNTWQQFAYSFIPTSTSTTIRFVNATSGDDNYAGLDNVSLDAVPEPTTLVLSGFAMIAAAVALRRKARS